MTHHGESGRVVIDIQPKLKRQLYAALSLSGSTLKDWFIKTAEEFCEEKKQPLFSRQVRYGRSKHSDPLVIREEADQVTSAAWTLSGDGTSGRKHTVVSMFSGCGGMDLGFTGGFELFGRRYRSLPFEIVWANDLNGEACKTYRRNLGHDIHRGDIWSLIDSLPQRADVLVGGFPCQDISVNGKRAGVNGSRSGLYKAMVEAIKRLKPKVFVAENVKALLRHEVWLQQVVSDFKGLGYNLHYQLYRAADYGVPQTRERVLFVGTAPDVKAFVPPAAERNAATWMTAREAIGDLEDLPESPGINHIWSLANRSPEQGNRRLVPDRPGYTIRAECHGNIQFHYKLSRRLDAGGSADSVFS